jgi:choline dehydrogenase-like flavoprotein
VAEPAPHHTVCVIGSGFGGTMTALALGREFKRRNEGETVLILERGTWWTTPVPTVQDREVETYTFLREKKQQPVQFWSTPDHFKGFIDLYTRCFRRRGNKDGLYDLVTFGKRGIFGLARNDGVTIMRASGVGGGSLVYSNITIQPPDLVLDDPRWPTSWEKAERDDYYALARRAIGNGALFALLERDHARDASLPAPPPPNPVNTGLSNIVFRSSLTLQPGVLDPGFRNPPTHPNLKQLDPAKYPDATTETRANDLWIDRARVFQLQMSKLTSDYGTVDLAINDKPIGPLDHKPKNYCERQGRCNVGCLPGARHTLNKQLMAAIHGTFAGDPPALGGFLDLEPLAEVDLVTALPEGGYQIDYRQREGDDPSKFESRQVTADRVIIAAGCVGSTELLLRCKAEGSILNLSERVGHNFSTNGDYLAFLDRTKFRISLTRGPVTTSFAHFNTPEADPSGDPAKFHTIEDQGIPKAFAGLVATGLPILQRLSKGQRKPIFVFLAVVKYGWKRLWRYLGSIFRNYRQRDFEFGSEDEWVMNMMCIAAMGREASVGQFRLGQGRDTPLRLSRTDGLPFYKDPIYGEIEGSLASFAKELTDENRSFRNPFLSPLAELTGSRSITLTHPLGGLPMGRSAADGAVDEFGRVFDTSKSGERPFHEGLYVADAARIPTALGVNPSLTISALALRTADQIIEELQSPVAAAPQPPSPSGAPAGPPG